LAGFKRYTARDVDLEAVGGEACVHATGGLCVVWLDGFDVGLIALRHAPGPSQAVIRTTRVHAAPGVRRCKAGRQASRAGSEGRR